MHSCRSRELRAKGPARAAARAPGSLPVGTLVMKPWNIASYSPPACLFGCQPARGRTCVAFPTRVHRHPLRAWPTLANCFSRLCGMAADCPRRVSLLPMTSAPSMDASRAEEKRHARRARGATAISFRDAHRADAAHLITVGSGLFNGLCLSSCRAGGLPRGSFRGCLESV